MSPATGSNRRSTTGAISGGADIESASVITTPGVAFIAGRFGFDAGIVISASHNPYEDNGLKVFLPNGRKLDEATERRIEGDIFDGSISVTSDERQVVRDQAEIFGKAYIDHLAGFFPDLSLNGMHIVVDCATALCTRLSRDCSRGSMRGLVLLTTRRTVET